VHVGLQPTQLAQQLLVALGIIGELQRGPRLQVRVENDDGQLREADVDSGIV